MPDDESRDNVLQIHPGRPPHTPAPPTFEPESGATAQSPDHIRTSAFDAPLVPVTPDLVPATFRSESSLAPDGRNTAADTRPPATGALSMAAVLAITLAAFEGLRNWVQEAGPRRAQAAAHQREMELLAAKADADATRYAAQAGHERAKAAGQRSRVPSGHEYGRSTLNGRSGGPKRGGGTSNPQGPRKAPSSRNSGSSGGRTGNAAGGPSGRRSGPSGHTGGSNSRTSPKPGGGTKRAGKSSKSGGGGGNNPADGTGRGSWWQRHTPKNRTHSKNGNAGPGASGTRGNSKPGPAHTSAKNGRAGLKDAARKAMQDRWNSRSHLHPFKVDKTRHKPATAYGKVNSTPKDDTAGRSEHPGRPRGSRTTFWRAVGETAQERWTKRRQAAHHTRRNSAPHTEPGTANPGTAGAKPGGDSAKPGGPDPKQHEAGTKPGAGTPEDHTFAWGPRTSPWETGPGPDPAPTITLERADGGPRSQTKRPSPPAGVTTGKQALPRAPQRPAGHRPGTTRRKDAIPMEPLPRATAAAPARMAPQHVTEITLDDALEALHALVTQGMDTHDDCAALAAAARKLLDALDQLAQDLPGTHNVIDPRVHTALAQLVEMVANLRHLAQTMGRDALAAAELAEAEEHAMNRDYRPISQATADAGLLTPSSPAHNEN